MKKTLFTLAALALLVAGFSISSCNKSEEMLAPNGGNAMNSVSTPEFNVDLVSNNVVSGSNFEWVWKVTAGNTKTGLSHFNFTDFDICEATSLRDALVGAAYSTDGINWTSSTVNWAVDKSQQSKCTSAEVMKIDVGASTIYYKLILNEEFGVGENNATGLFKRGGGSKRDRDAGYKDCGFLAFDGPTCLPEEEKCYEYDTESAWSAGSRYVSQGNWATYSSATDLANGVTIFAGQTINIGTAKLVNGSIEITLTGGWELQPNTDAVKIQGYNTAPSGNPAPGQFTTYKGSSLTPSVSSFNFYGIHLDVRKAYEVDCPE